MTIAYDTLAPGYARHREGYGYVIAMLARLFEQSPGESDLRTGPLQCASELAFLWAQRP